MAHSVASELSATLDWPPDPEDADCTVLTQVCQCFIQRIRKLKHKMKPFVSLFKLPSVPIVEFAHNTKQEILALCILANINYGTSSIIEKKKTKNKKNKNRGTWDPSHPGVSEALVATSFGDLYPYHS